MCHVLGLENAKCITALHSPMVSATDLHIHRPLRIMPRWAVVWGWGMCSGQCSAKNVPKTSANDRSYCSRFSSILWSNGRNDCQMELNSQLNDIHILDRDPDTKPHHQQHLHYCT